MNFDHIDQQILDAAMDLRKEISGPRIGDFVYFASGQLERLSHDWGEGIQTSPGGSFFLSKSGHASLSCGGLNPCVPRTSLECTSAVLPGEFWFFKHGVPGAGRAVYFEVPCRVFKTSAPYEGFLGDDFKTSRDALIRQLIQQLGDHA
jgi:hypothetical protein